jgi:hypothetical protein
MSLEQAEAVSEALQQALEGSLGHLATRPDLDTLRTTLQQDLKHVKWMVGVNMTLVVLVLGKLLLFMP